MKRLLPGLALAAFTALGCADGALEIPTVELGGSGGARLMNGQTRSPADAYEKAYSTLIRSHYNVRRNLETRNQNQFAAREAMGQIFRSLDTMRACVPPADQARFDPYLVRYGAWHKDLENGTWGGSFLTEFDRAEREVRAKFNPSTTEVLAEFTGAAPKPPSEKPAESGLTSDKVEVPNAKTPPTEEPSTPKPVVPPPPPPPPPGATTRVLFKAWSTAHDELVAAYKARQPCKAKYEELVESLRLLKAQHSGEKATKLQIYLDYYAALAEKTKVFTALPEKTAEADIVDELEIPARVIRKDYSPDPK